MTTLTIEFPKTVSQDLIEQGVSSAQLEQIIVRFVQFYLKNTKEKSAPKSKWSSGSDFALRMIENNRELFEELARL